MHGFPRPFASEDTDERRSSSSATSSHDADGATFDAYDEFDPDHLPDPGPFLDGADVLTGDDHAAFHRLTREMFEARGVYDATFGYNLARLNLDARHPDAGFRYAVAPDDPNVLLAEFTPTTAFCPQSDSLTVGAFRAWNGLRDRHEYDRVRVAVAPMHHQSARINEKLRRLDGRLQDGDGAGATVEIDGTASRSDDGTSGGRDDGRDGRRDGGPSTPF